MAYAAAPIPPPERTTYIIPEDPTESRFIYSVPDYETIHNTHSWWRQQHSAAAKRGNQVMTLVSNEVTGLLTNGLNHLGDIYDTFNEGNGLHRHFLEQQQRYIVGAVAMAAFMRSLWNTRPGHMNLTKEGKHFIFFISGQNPTDSCLLAKHTRLNPDIAPSAGAPLWLEDEACYIRAQWADPQSAAVKDIQRHINGFTADEYTAFRPYLKTEAWQTLASKTDECY